ncbi:butyrophilin subfamily 3 member A2-like [Centropristis striata]|uniref:butyrophilin subfamily 3 member A2-like n=1 Tax=Centropristis striata TaxID=184440 RepID=UPI0027E0F7AD|nr:butyrophilin subfamily 3 member A2-like [Centropristis striata]
MLLSLQSPVRLLSVLVFHLLLTHPCRGQSQLVVPSQPIVANIGDDIILPCHLEPADDVAAMTLEWTRLGLSLKLVNVWRDGRDLDTRSPSYRGRTFLFTDELKKGNISLKLSTVKPSDTGRYKCFIPEINKESFIELVVGAVSSPIISLRGIDRDKEGVVLQCESSGWYPEPEVLWLDGEGKLLSAGPTETVRGPDDLYTVSSRVTVEKRHSNSFTCRVHQKDTNHTTETHITVPDDFFEVRSSSTSTIAGLAVGQLSADNMELKELNQRIEKEVKKLIEELKDKLEENQQSAERERLRTNKELKQTQDQLEKMTAEFEQNKSQLNKQIQIQQQRAEKAEGELKELRAKHEEVEKTKAEEADEDVKKRKKQHKQDGGDEAQQSQSPQPVKQNSSSTDGFDIKLYQQNKCIYLKNDFNEEKQLLAWELRVQFINKEPVRHV